jgi:hypothetical protein
MGKRFLGVVLQFVIASGAAAVYWFASRKIPFLLRRVAVCGVLFGAAVFLFMRYVIVPLSSAPNFKIIPMSYGRDLLVHLFLIGLPIALCAKYFAAKRRV